MCHHQCSFLPKLSDHILVSDNIPVCTVLWQSRERVMIRISQARARARVCDVRRGYNLWTSTTSRRQVMWCVMCVWCEMWVGPTSCVLVVALVGAGDVKTTLESAESSSCNPPHSLTLSLPLSFILTIWWNGGTECKLVTYALAIYSVSIREDLGWADNTFTAISTYRHLCHLWHTLHWLRLFVLSHRSHVRNRWSTSLFTQSYLLCNHDS